MNGFRNELSVGRAFLSMHSVWPLGLMAMIAVAGFFSACRDNASTGPEQHQSAGRYDRQQQAAAATSSAAQQGTVAHKAAALSDALLKKRDSMMQPGTVVQADGKEARASGSGKMDSGGADAVGDVAGEGQPVLSNEMLYAIAMETQVRAMASRSGRVLGYLRAGAHVHRSGQPVSTDGCKGGWYAVEPQGFVCNGLSATLDANARIVQYAQPGARRGEMLPFGYAFVRPKVPHYYHTLPSEQDIRRIEGADAMGAIRAAYHRADPNLGELGDPREVPTDLLQGGHIPKPPGTAPRLRFKLHTGRAEPRTRLAINSWFVHENRRWAITSQLDLVAIDKLRVIKPSRFHGVELQPGQRLPVGFAPKTRATGYRFDEQGNLVDTVTLEPRAGFILTGEMKQSKGNELVATSEGIWVPKRSLTIVKARDTIPTFVKNDTIRWLDISVQDQTLVAYRGKQPVFATLVSTGAGGMGDPDTTRSTPRGLFSIFSKHVTAKMSGDEIGSEYWIDDVPYVQYFHKGYALHAAFWHDNFGRVQSSGCVNLAPADALWVFAFTGPEVPDQWHARYVKSGGTPVLIRR